MNLRDYCNANGQSNLALVPSTIAQVSELIDAAQVDDLKMWKPEIATTTLDKETFAKLVFIDNNHTRHLLENGRSLNQVAEYIHTYGIEKALGFSHWYDKARDIYRNFDYRDFGHLFLKPTNSLERKASENGCWYLEGGNHRSLALAIKVFLEDFEYIPVHAILLYF